MNLPGETKAGNAAMQPMPRGKPGGLIETMNGAQRLPFCAPQEDHIGSEDPDALKIAARRAEYSLTENARSPFQAEPEQLDEGNGDMCDRRDSPRPGGLKIMNGHTCR